MIKKMVFGVAVLALTGFMSANAVLIGDEIYGELRFGGHGDTNFLDTANGFVPALSGSSGIQPLAIVTEDDVANGYAEFEYLDSANGFHIDVDANTISVHEFVVAPGPLNFWELLISDLDWTDAAGRIVGYEVLTSNFGDSLTIETGSDFVGFSFDGSISNDGDGLIVEIVLDVDHGVDVPEGGDTVLLLSLTILSMGGLGKIRNRI